MTLSPGQFERYGRQILLPEIGLDGQERLLAARVLVVGAGGLGSPVSFYLAAAGVGSLTVVDADRVDLSNLHRQILHRTEDVGRPKAERAAEALGALNGDVRIDTRTLRLDETNVDALLAGHDVVVDGSDNFGTRFLLNDAALRLGVPLVHGAVQGFGGQVMVVRAGEGGCFRCLFEAPPPPGQVPPCSEAGVIGAVAGTIGAVMATEALKVLLGAGDPLAGRLWIHDGLAGRTRTIRVPRNPECPACG